MRKVFVGTVGYHFLTDYSIGPKLLPELKAMRWADGVDVDECNWGPVAVVQQMEAMTQPYDRVILLTASDMGRPMGEITLKRWRGGPATPEQVQGRINEGVTGVISVDNLLVIGHYFGIWPAEVIVVDVQPGAQESGDVLNPDVAKVVPQVKGLLQHLAHCDSGDLPAMLDVYVSDLDVNQSYKFSAYMGGR